ncbi:putative nucleotidyltransferase [Nocardioides zeae]|uniref:Nucleotidyltransferase n=1 Tax=Nocardioides zeae TaxID=1457234 RepID=A0ACC6IDU5_9ACTN|nr:hypothetical protein [Nocardioides zeae]MDR6174094.1 putative nucleotidyltransferase [Nocardioides zeae]MDR6208901.1 putative nucleotidyltransferase [Nocardioides zeae]
MLDFRSVPADDLALVDHVCAALVGDSPGRAGHLMIVGAHARDIIHTALGHTSSLRRTDDVDCAIVIDDWKVYDELTAPLQRVGATGIRFDVGGIRTDLMPFGAVEQPAGTVTPAARREPMSVWGFRETFAAAHALALPNAGEVRIPTIAGYSALKLMAWLDRSAHGDYKDAGDLATALLWSLESTDAHERFWNDTTAIELSEGDPRPGTARLLGSDVTSLLGPQRATELRERWPGERPYALIPEMKIPGPTPWPNDLARRLEILNAFEAGLGVSLTTM